MYLKERKLLDLNPRVNRRKKKKIKTKGAIKKKYEPLAK